MPTNFKRNVIIAFGVSLFLLLISSIASFISIKNLISSAKWVEHTNQVITEMENVMSLLNRAESSQRGFLLTGDESFIEPYSRSSTLVKEKLTTIRELTRDNQLQQQNTAQLNQLITVRMQMLETGVQTRKAGTLVDNNFLARGRQYMEEINDVLRTMEQMERNLLEERTITFQRFITYTPVLIIIAALLSILITIFFYGRIISDYKKRAYLQEQLEIKEREVGERLAILHSIAEKISAGNYSARIGDENKDLLGSVGVAMNKMAESLSYSFGLLSDKDWYQAGIAGLNNKMLGEQDIKELIKNILDYLVNYTNSNIGAFYLLRDYEELELMGSYALDKSVKKIVKKNEGVIGQVATDKKMILLDNLTEDHFKVNVASGSLAPVNISIIPILHEGHLKGVIELGKITSYNKNELEFLESISYQAGVAINTAQSRQRLQELLEETQSQSEELQVQHAELESVNEALKSKSQRLQVSEEELRVQQEEMLQTNTELEERTLMLQEKNNLVLERNREIHQKAKELEITTKYKSEFLANMSHELRTPLNSILLLSRLMVDKNQNEDGEIADYARVIEKSGHGLLSLIDEILDLSRIEAGKMEINHDELTVKEVTNDISDLFLPVAKEKNIEFNVELASNIPERIVSDKLRLEQILKNLVSNAIKFTAAGQVQLIVSKDNLNSDRILFTVKDTGIGIPEDKQELIFEAFQQADGSTRRQYGGTGLGLSISRELAKLLGGSISLKSEPGKGSEFQLSLHVTSPMQPGEIKTSTQTAKREVTVDKDEKNVLITEDNTSAKMTQVIQRIENVLTKEPKKVLIVEENPVHAKALSYFLENFNIVPQIKTGIDESVDAFIKKDVDCIILDLDTSNGQSYDQLADIKKIPGLELLPIILFTGKTLSKLEEGRLKQFVNSIVIKTAHSYQRILDEVSLFLHLSHENGQKNTQKSYRDLGRLSEVLKDKKVLIADDDVRNIFSLSRVLESVGMITLSATDGKEALEKLKEDSSVDIILMDMMMPELDGYETMTRIRLTQGISRIPIIAVTAKAMAEDRQKCIEAGASDYITKPVDSDQLMSLLRVWLYDRN